jgi:hypothetical protein
MSEARSKKGKVLASDMAIRLALTNNGLLVKMDKKINYTK